MLLAPLAAIIFMTASPAAINTTTGRDRYLATPRPWPAARVDSPARRENGRLWHSRSPIGNRTPLAEQTYPRTNAARFGAPASLDNAIIYTRVNHQTIAIDPWNAFTDTGFDHYRRAQNIWLREQGWVLKVRTHVNSRYQYDHNASASASLPQPRATIRLRRDPSAPVFPSKMRVNNNDALRIHRPTTAMRHQPFRVIVPITSTTELASVPPESNTTRTE